jgi:hypothetical protein
VNLTLSVSVLANQLARLINHETNDRERDLLLDLEQAVLTSLDNYQKARKASA